MLGGFRLDFVHIARTKSFPIKKNGVVFVENLRQTPTWIKMYFPANDTVDLPKVPSEIPLRGTPFSSFDGMSDVYSN